MNRDVLAQMIQDGLSSYKIARQLGTSQTNVRYWAKKYDLKLPGKKKKVKPPRPPRPLQLEPITKKVCTRCSQEKDIQEFTFRNKQRGKRDTRCNVCTREIARDYYARHQEAFRARSARRNRHARQTVEIQLLAYLKDKQCVDCGERDPVVFEFDHVTGTKHFAISQIIGSWQPNWQRVIEEIAKCEIRCVNCHRRKTARERGYLRMIYSK